MIDRDEYIKACEMAGVLDRIGIKQGDNTAKLIEKAKQNLKEHIWRTENRLQQLKSELNSLYAAQSDERSAQEVRQREAYHKNLIEKYSNLNDEDEVA